VQAGPGKTNAELAAGLFMSVATVRARISHVLGNRGTAT
jgi:DNA-binding CsgD family transcriptional regulator